MKYLVSIIIPIYNMSQFLPDLFKNICAITYQNIEVIFIDDCSTDKSYYLLKDFCSKFNKANVIKNKKNMGVAYSRNEGIAKSKGNLFFFIDADDAFHPQTLQLYIDCMIKNNVDLVTSKNCSFLSYNDLSFVKITKKTLDKATVSNNADKNLALFLTTNYKLAISPGVCWNKLFKRDLLKKIDSYPNVFNPNLSFCEDTVFTTQYLHLCKSVSFINKCLYFHREHSGSIMHSNFNNKWFDLLKSFEHFNRMNITHFKYTQRNIKSLKSQFSYLILNKMFECKYTNFDQINKVWQTYIKYLKYTPLTYKHFRKKFFFLTFIKAKRIYKKLINKQY